MAKGQFALDRLRASHWQRLRASDPARARWVKDTRFALRRGPARRSEADRDLIGQLAETNQELYRALLWCDQLRATIAGVDPEAARTELESLIAAAPSLGHRRFTMLAGTLSRHIELILNTIRHRLSNGRIEAMNSTVRLISHRARGFRKVQNLIGLVHLICGPIKVALPT